ncbi:hypothetical protein GPECTOR_8g52 [Gonium pectorale]|uniref:GrpE protein homolog n=1 Tax=Gonium pectorale TaxID=33097 RepID=A0A150GTQ1_GONPE|nr:hypothetical protein GPECTOR_8g52 [Gonium pectorale]|eukprot:KXZ53058.1 hypothetical protein GPECTOR_8g52 [Gonium pectorale]
MSSGLLRRFGSALLNASKPITVAPFTSGVDAIGRPITLRLWSRSFATAKDSNEGKKDDSSEAVSDDKSATSASADDGAADESASAGPSAQELISQMKVKEEQAAKLAQQVEALTDSLKRNLAEMENLRQRTAREVDVSKKFAIQGFVKALLDVPDNLERAASVVPPEALKEDGGLPPEKLRNLLSGLLEGVRATESILMKVLKQHGVERYDPAGQLFDPNLHNALFDVPDPTKDNNTIAMVTKVR